jgi:thymidylate synthase
MRNYLDLLRHAHDNGSRQINERTGEVTLKVVGPQLRYDLQAGFPLVTTSKKHLRSIIEELLWFIRGDTNNELLRARGVSIWDEWALVEPHVRQRPLSNYDRAEIYAKREGVPLKGVLTMLENLDREEGMRGLRPSSSNGGEPNGGEKFLNDQDIPTYVDQIIHGVGELGPIYGRMWRYWPNPDGTTTDQLVQVLNDLKERPFSRRHIVTAWNPSVLPDETVNAQENVRRGRQALAPCHAFYQFVVEQLDQSQRVLLYIAKRYPGGLSEVQASADHLLELVRLNEEQVEEGRTFMIEEMLRHNGIPDKRLGTVVTQRSADIPLGVPYNIASYAILTMMIANQLNFALGELVMNFGDAHIYHKQMEGVREQLSREPRPLPQLLINPDVKNFFDYKFEDFQLVGYDSHPTIKYEITV